VVFISDPDQRVQPPAAAAAMLWLDACWSAARDGIAWRPLGERSTDVCGV